jgi:hypothetical protein
MRCFISATAGHGGVMAAESPDLMYRATRTFSSCELPYAALRIQT